MIRFRLELSLLFLALLLSSVAWRRWHEVTIRMVAAAPIAPLIKHQPRSFPSAVLDSAAGMASSYDLFRLAGAPAAVPFEAVPSNHAAPVERPVNEHYRPSLTVKGISGPPWMALVEGIPGKPGATLVKVDMTIDRLRVRAIMRDTVVLEGPDTTWKLTIKRGRS